MVVQISVACFARECVLPLFEGPLGAAPVVPPCANVTANLDLTKEETKNDGEIVIR